MSDLSPASWTENLRELSLLFDEHLVPRVQRSHRRGVLLAALSMFAFTISVVLIGTEWDRELESARAIDEHLRVAVRASHMSPRSLSELGKVALLLANANLDPAEPVQVHQLPDRWRTMFEAFEREIQWIKRRQVAISPCADGSSLTGIVAPFDSLAAYKTATRAYPLAAPVPVIEARDRVATVDGFAFGPAGCLVDDMAGSPVATFIPSPLLLESWNSKPEPSNIDAVCGSTTLLDRTACLIADAADTLEEHAPDWSNQADLAQAYFISTTGALAVWSRGADVQSTIWRDPMAWYASASTLTYFTQRPTFVNHGKILITPVYFDFMGMGLVRTACAPVYRDKPLTWLDSTDDPEAFAGTFCIDVSVPVTGLEDAQEEADSKKPGVDLLNKPVNLDTPLFEASLYCATGGTVFELKEAPGTCAATAKIAALSADEARLIAKAADEPYARTGPVNLSSPESQGAGAAVLRRVENSSDKVVVLLRPKRLTPDPYRLVGGGAAFVLSMAFAGLASRRSQEERTRLTVLELLRSLPVGVAMLDDKDNIVFGNDRAEELFGAAFPSNWEDPDQSTEQRFDRQFKREDAGKELKVQVVPIKPDGLTYTSTQGQRSQQAFFKEDVALLRKRGRPYIYRVMLPASGGDQRWLFVRGTPILRGPDAPRRPGHRYDWFALGVFDIELPPAGPSGKWRLQRG